MRDSLERGLSMRGARVSGVSGVRSLAFIAFLAGLVAAADVPSSRFRLDAAPFEFGVASADPTDSSVLIWTRVSTSDEFHEIHYAVWREVDDSSVFGVGNLTGGSAFSNATNDHTITVDAANLPSNTWLNYRFYSPSLNGLSRTGRTRTAPSKNDVVTSAKFVTFSCSKHHAGFMNSYREIATDDSIDGAWHTGDWLYPEYEVPDCERIVAGQCRTQVRKLCEGETIEVDVPGLPMDCSDDDTGTKTVRNMRVQHRMLRADVDVRDALARMPWSFLPDNHDLGADKDGAVVWFNSTSIAYSNGLKVWTEWMPSRYEFREEANVVVVDLFRKWTWGSFLDFVVLDTRDIVTEHDFFNDELSHSVSEDVIYNEGVNYLGPRQWDFIKSRVLSAENRTEGWRVFAMQVPFAPWNLRSEAFAVAVMIPISIVAVPIVVGLLACTIVSKARKLSPEKDDAPRCRPEFVEKMDRACCGDLCFKATAASLGVIVILYFVAVVIGVQTFPKDSAPVGDPKTGEYVLKDRNARHLFGRPDFREMFFNALDEAQSSNDNVVISGDMHGFVQSDLKSGDRGFLATASVNAPGFVSRNYGTEFNPSSTSSENVDERINRMVGKTLGGLLNLVAVPLANSLMRRSNPHFRVFDWEHHGYGIMNFTTESVVFEHRKQDKHKAGAKSSVLASFEMKKGESKVKPI